MKSMRTPSKDRLITTALRQIAFEGWTETAFEKAEKVLGAKAGTYTASFPGGMEDFIEAVQAWADAAMHKKLEAHSEFSAAKVREKIFIATLARLEALAPYREAMRRLAGRQLLPWHKFSGVKSLARTADAIWKAAGDRSIDYNYYTKRILLSGVYAVTLNTWFADESPDFAETRTVLKARIEDVLRVGKAIGGIKERFSRKAA